MYTGEIIQHEIYGHLVDCRVLRIDRFSNGAVHTIDLERLNDGKCFRVTGLYIPDANYRASISKYVASKMARKVKITEQED